MRIGLIRMKYTPYGGAEAFLERFISGLVKKGHEVEVFSSRWEGGGAVKVHKVEASGPSFLRPLTFALNAKKAVEKARPDIVISLERTFCQDIYRAGDGCHREWLERRAKTVSPLKRLLINLNPLHTVLLNIEKRLFSDERLKKVVANSEAVRRDIIRHYGLPEKKICVIYNGIDPAGYNPVNEHEKARLRGELGLEKDAFICLFVGSGFERKGLKYLIRAVASLRDKKGLRLVVVGKGKASGYIDEAKALGIGGNVIFKGPVKGALKYYQAADVFALPSIYEPFSNACLEAMATGLPVVTTRVNGASEVIKDGVSGGVVEDPTDADEIARKLALFFDKKKRAEAGWLARKAAEALTIEKNVEGFLALIDEIGRDRV